MSPLLAMLPRQWCRFPRVSGDEPKTTTAKQPHFKFSLREWG